ncbi:MAG: chloride channel protein [Myxococcota bacterium]
MFVARPQSRLLDLRFAAALAAVSLSAALFAILFRGALQLALGWLFDAHDTVSAMRAVPVWARVLVPALGALLGGLAARRAAGGPAGQVGDVMEAVVVGRVRLSLPRTLWKSLASWLAIVSGGSLGREGPLIQFGGAAGHTIAQRFGLEPRDGRLLIAAGTAAGFAAAYNTPFAATLFVLEVVLGVVVLDAFVPVLVATVVAATLTRAVIGPGPIYGPRSFHMSSSWELLLFFLLGVLGALAAQGFMRLLSRAEKALRRPTLPLPLRPALGGLVAGLFVAVLPEVAGNGAEPLNALLDATPAVSVLVMLMVGKVLATTASVSSGSPGGVFTPTLLLGACVGTLLALAAGALGWHGLSLGGFALVGMAATTAATTHAPLMAAVMVFELSGDYAVALPLLLATATATWISRWLRPESIYTAELTERGVAWELTIDGRREAGRDA